MLGQQGISSLASRACLVLKKISLNHEVLLDKLSMEMSSYLTKFPAFIVLQFCLSRLLN